MSEKKIDVNSETSDRKGLGGILETLLRKFKILTVLVLLSPVYFVASVCLGVSLSPGILLVRTTSSLVEGAPLWLELPAIGTAIAMGYFLYGITLIFMVALVNLPIKPLVKPFRGSWYSLQSIPWFIHNSLTYAVRYTFLEFVTPTPLNILFYRMMGMKIGKGVMINTTNITDPCMITLGDYVIVGGIDHNPFTYLHSHHPIEKNI